MTEYVNDMLADGWDYGLALTVESDMDSEPDRLVFHMKEGDYPPELVIEYEYPATDSWALIYGSLGVSVVLIVAAAWLLKKPRIRGGGKKR